MKPSRRQVLGLGLAGGAAALSGCGPLLMRAGAVAEAPLPDHLDLPKSPVHPTVRLLNRAGFGPRPGEVASVMAEGHEAWLEKQIHPDESEDPILAIQLRRIDSLTEHGSELEDERQNDLLRQMQQASLLRAIYGKHQLRERMADIWANHFNIYARKNDEPNQVASDNAAVVRKHALGKFPDMLRASAHSPAMLTYLDNQVNLKGVANENYARELMELHTLGVHGGYSQKDVQEVARCFTGWGVENGFLQRRGEFKFEAERHDDGEKTVLGHVIPAGGGQQDGEQVLDILATHHNTARFVASKICRNFLGTTDTPWVDKLSAIYLQTGGDIPSMLKPLLLSKELLEGPPVAKRPIDFVASALRALDVRSDGDTSLQAHLESMGQPPHQWPMPDGYPEKASAWTGSILERWRFAFAVTSGQVPGCSVDLTKLFDRVTERKSHAAIELTLGRKPEAEDSLAETLIPHENDLATLTALCVASPEFQWR